MSRAPRAARRGQEDGVREPAQQQDGQHEEGEVYRLAVAAPDDYAEYRKGPHGGAAGRHGQPRRRAPWPRRPFAKTSGQMGPPAEASSTRGRATQPCWPERPSAPEQDAEEGEDCGQGEQGGEDGPQG